jgi:hypothetical protein
MDGRPGGARVHHNFTVTTGNQQVSWIGEEKKSGKAFCLESKMW